MDRVLIVLALLAAWGLFVAVKPDKACSRCGGWGHRRKRRRPRACVKCKGTGRHLRLTGRLVSMGIAAGMRAVRERQEREP